MAAPPLLAALAATLLPARAAAGFARHPDPELSRAAARLAALPRAERLAALAAALDARPRPSGEALAKAAAAERARLAVLVRAGDEATALSPLLRRLVLERGWGDEG